MPKLEVIQARSTLATHTFAVVDAVSSSEAASLKGQQALTPLIAGSVCGGLMGIAWIIGFTIYFVKRSKRKKRNARIAAGKALPKPRASKVPDENVIIPPDPAILLGHRTLGENAFKDEKYPADSPHIAQPIPHGSKVELIAAEQAMDAKVDRISDEMAVPPTT